MAMDLFGKLGGAIGELVDEFTKTGTDQNAKIAAAQNDIAELKRQETEIFAEIGRQAFEANPSAYAQGEKLQPLQADLAAAEARLAVLHEEQEKAQQARENAGAVYCPSCKFQNVEGTKFCQQCGAKLGKAFCTACGAELVPGVRFCGACGVKQAE